MNVLVAYASRHGSTAGIAERIADRLSEAGIAAEARPVKEVGDVNRYDAFVVGSAAYMYRWLKEASSFVKRNNELLAERPVWIFSSGPLGDDPVDAEGKDLLEVSRPKEFEELEQLIQPRGDHVFFGAWDPEAPPVGAAERMLKFMPAAKKAMPSGDFRDWDAIDSWADEIAGTLKLEAGQPEPDSSMR